MFGAYDLEDSLLFNPFGPPLACCPQLPRFEGFTEGHQAWAEALYEFLSVEPDESVIVVSLFRDSLSGVLGGAALVLTGTDDCPAMLVQTADGQILDESVWGRDIPDWKSFLLRSGYYLSGAWL